MDQRDTLKATMLASEGLVFSNSLREENRAYFDNLTSSYFSIAAAISLTWTKHAKLETDYVEYAARFIDGKIAHDPEIARKFCLRFGPEELDEALINYAKFYRTVKNKMPDFHTCSMNEIARLQVNLLSELNNLKNAGEVVKIGPWLFTGPFKIILGDQDRLWTNDGINAIVLPTGIEVDRALVKLQKEGYGFMNGFDRNWLTERGPLLDSYGTYQLAHSFIVSIGKLAGCPAIHINSALYLLGRDEI
ncbi:MAG: hypothetical protein KF763_04595 [Cyclobacteriaceae bacterium]|nr:hypothetical protein [Cyclobacteriaceae bacterium]